jgi:hypothetical protein
MYAAGPVGHLIVMDMKSMLPIRNVLCATCVMMLLAAVSAQPVYGGFGFGINTVSGATPLPSPPPPNVHPGFNEGNLPIVFPEVLNGTIVTTGANPLGMDTDHDGSNVVAAPTISGNIVNPSLTPTTIPVGTKFNSYLFHFDPVGSPFTANYITTITFDNPIIGVQLFGDGFSLQKPAGTPYTGTEEQGDLQVFLNGGPPVTYYPAGLPSRGIEEDSFMLAISGGNTVVLAGSAHGAEIDEVRIITAAPIFGGTPEPATFTSWAMITVLGACGTFAWRRQRNAVLAVDN